MSICWPLPVSVVRSGSRRLLSQGRHVTILVCCLCLHPSQCESVSAPGGNSLGRGRGAVRENSLVSLSVRRTRSRGTFRVALLDDARAWKRMPATVRGGGGPLPTWARALAASLPRTTASMLELDYLHRARSPLHPLLRGQARWVVAQANGCRYSSLHAEADLRRAGMSEHDLRQLALSTTTRPLAERKALDFARKLTLSAQEITDQEVADLIGIHGEKQVVALVLLVAYANFQDRLLLALDLPLEPDGPLAPLDVRFTPIPFGGDPPPPVRSAPLAPPPASTVPTVDPEWNELTYADLRRQLKKQQQRRARIHLPGGNAGTVRWGQVCRLYQPELASAWAVCARSFGAEADQDPIFEESLFWIVTRSLQCFY